MADMIISVIIPMYNAENFIGECLRRILNQTFQDFEVIVVDDCSTDNSCGVVENLKSSFGTKLNLIKLDKNSGCAAIPRNVGMKNSRGKYLMFVDSDDAIKKTALEELYNVAENFQADVVHAERIYVHSEKNGEFETKIDSLQRGNFVDSPTLESSDIAERIKKFTNQQTHWWSVSRLYLRKFIADNKIEFPPIRVFEDFVFSFNCIVKAEKFVRVPNVIYHWRIRNDSTSHKPADLVTLTNQVSKVVKYLDDIMRNEKFFSDNLKAMYSVINFFMQQRLQVFGNIAFKGNAPDVSEIYEEIYQKVFSKFSADTAALNSYLLIMASFYKAYSEQQNKQVEELKSFLKKN